MIRCGPGDYIVATPTYPLLVKKLLPEFIKVYKRWYVYGEMHAQEKRFTFSLAGCRRMWGNTYDADHLAEHPTNVWFGYAADPESLESATAKAAWLDEAGQKKFKLGSWEAILRRLSLAQGRVLITTTPYDLGWLKQQIYDRAMAGNPDYDAIRFDSTENPSFPKAEMERAKRELPIWKFNMFYRGIYTRPAGMIYDCFIDEPVPTGHLVKRFAIPDSWPRFLGIDFGGVNTAGVFLAQECDGEGRRLPRFVAYREYHEGGRTAKDHGAALLKGEPQRPSCVGGSKSEGQWRDEFAAGGLSVSEPDVSDVEVGIDRVYGAFKRGELQVMDDLDGLRAELMAYSRVLDDQGEPTEAIEDKASFHHLDALRYIGTRVFGVGEAASAIVAPDRDFYTEAPSHEDDY